MKSAGIHPLAIAAVWPTGLMPLVMWGGSGPRAVIPIALRPVKTADFLALNWQDLIQGAAPLPRFIGLFSYDEFCGQACVSAPSYIYEIHEALVWDHQIEPTVLCSGEPRTCPLRIQGQDLRELLKSAAEYVIGETKGAALASSLSDESYMSLVYDIQTDIRRGRYYQLNLLRWFRMMKPWTWRQVCNRLATHGGPFSSILRHGNFALASFSPERFIAVSREGTLSTWPIKGTVERNLKNPGDDQKRQDGLKTSEKDLAELHMIVDLMRNDLSRVCEAASVEVLDPGSVQTFAHVHHLQACVSGKLRKDISLRELFSSLCPAGSITGAPKIEVMRRIRELEGQDRGYMMGNAFLINADGSIDSSVLIRTMVSKDGLRTWEYAAGSGIVIKSQAEHELAEVRAKCRPLTD